MCAVLSHADCCAEYHEILIGVWDPTDSFNIPVGKQRLVPSGIWYTSISGIWQTVRE